MMPASPPADRAAFAALFATMLIVGAGNTAMQSVLPAIGRELSIPDVLIAFVFSVSALAWAIASPLWAREADRRGRKAMVALGVWGFIVSMAACGAVILAGLKGVFGALAAVIAIILARLIYGIFGSASQPAAQAIIAERTSVEQRTEAIAKLSSAFGLGTVIGPAVAPFLILPFLGLSGPMFGAALVGVAVLLIVLRYLPSDAPRSNTTSTTPRKRISWFDPRVKPFLVYGFSLGFVQAAASQSIGFFIIDALGLQPEAAQPFIGVALMAAAAVTLLGQWGLIPLFKLTARQLLWGGAAMAAAGLGLLAISDSFAAIVTAFAIMSLGFGLGRPGFSAGASIAVGPDEQAAVAGAVSSVNGAVWVAAPAIGVMLYGLNAHLPYALGAVTMLALLVYAMRNPTLTQAGTPAQTPTLSDQ
jgi:MFS family permease